MEHAPSMLLCSQLCAWQGLSCKPSVMMVGFANLGFPSVGYQAEGALGCGCGGAVLV